MAAKLSPAMIEMIRDAALHTNGILRGNSRTQEALIKRGLAEDIRNGSGIVHVYLTDAGRDAARSHVPDGILPGDVSEADTPVMLAEVAAAEHFANATSEDMNRAFYLSDAYQASHAKLMAAIIAAYPDTDAEAVYAVWVDCDESIAYCANWVREQVIADAADAARMAAENAADAAHDAEVDAARLNLSTVYRRFLTGRENDPRTALALAHAHSTLAIDTTPVSGDELTEFTYTLPAEVYGVPVERVVRAVFGDVNVYDDGVLLCGVARHFTDAGARRAVAVLARRILPDVMADVDAQGDAPVLHTGDRAISDSWEESGEITWTREIRNVWYAFTMVRLPDGRVRTTATREDYYVTEDFSGAEVENVNRTRLHTIITGDAAPVPLVGPRGPVETITDDKGVVRTWDRTIAGTPFRFILGVSHTNGAVCATAWRTDTREPIRVVVFRTATQDTPRVPSVADTTIHVGTWRESCASHGCPGCVTPSITEAEKATLTSWEYPTTQPPMVTLPPRTIAGGKRSVPRKRSGRRSSGWRKASKGGKR